MQKSLNPFYRIFIFSIASFWKVVFSRRYADKVHQATRKDLVSEPETESIAEEAQTEEAPVEPPPAPVEVAPEPPKAPEIPETVDGIHLLSLLQKTGRLVDFLQQDITPYSNEEIGEALRVVHEGCSQVLKDYFTIEAVRTEEEGTQVTVATDYDPSSIRLSGNVQGNPPYTGELVHPGWQVKSFKLPQRTDAESDSKNLLAPAEVEI